jgi:hypothetical protein
MDKVLMVHACKFLIVIANIIIMSSIVKMLITWPMMLMSIRENSIV